MFAVEATQSTVFSLERSELIKVQNQEALELHIKKKNLAIFFSIRGYEDKDSPCLDMTMCDYLWVGDEGCCWSHWELLLVFTGPH